MPDQFEKIRRLLVADSYSGCDMEVDQRVHQASDRCVEVLRRYIRNGRELERLVNQAETVADVAAIVDRLESIAAEEQAVIDSLQQSTEVRR